MPRDLPPPSSVTTRLQRWSILPLPLRIGWFFLVPLLAIGGVELFLEPGNGTWQEIAGIVLLQFVLPLSVAVCEVFSVKWLREHGYHKK